MSDIALAPDLFGFADVAVSRSQRSRVTNDPVKCHRGTTAAGRRTRDVFLSFMTALGNPVNVAVQAGALKAARLVVAAEIAGAKIIDAGGDLNDLVRIENAADRAVRRLGLPVAAAAPHVPLRDRIAAQTATSAAPVTAAVPPSLRERLAAGAVSAIAEAA